MRQLLLIPLALLMAALCSAAEPEKAKVVTEKDKAVLLKKGEQLVVKLPAQLSTLCGWHVIEIDKEKLELEDDKDVESIEEKVDPKVGPMDGGIEFQVLKFKTKGIGKFILELGYKRPTDKKSDKTYKLEVKIE
jgi:predicted secreted protein